MHTVLTRLNALGAYTMSVLAFLTFLCFLSTFFCEYSANANIDTVNVVVKHVSDYSASREKNDLGFLVSSTALTVIIVKHLHLILDI